MKTTLSKTHKKRPAILATSIAALVAFSLAGFAPKAKADQYWDGAGVVANGVLEGGAGTWDAVTTNWNLAGSGAGVQGVFNSANGIAHFLLPSAGGAGPFLVGVNANLNVSGGINFDGGSYTFNNAGAGAFNLGFGNLVVNLNSGTPVVETFQVQIINAGALTVNNNGSVGNTLVVTNTTNNYSGGTTVNGTSILLNGNVTSALGSGAVTMNGNNSTFGTNLAGPVSIGNDIVINAGLGNNVNLSGTGALTLTNIVLSTTGSITQVGGGSTTISGTISGGANGVTYQGGSFTYAATEKATYTGLTTVQNNATLLLNSTNANNAILGNVTINSTGTVQLGVANQIADTSTVTVNTGAFFNLNGFGESIKTLNGGGLNSVVQLKGATLGVVNGDYSGNIVDAGPAGGGIFKTGTPADVLKLSGSNAYTGNTTITGGSILAGSGTAFSQNSNYVLGIAGTTLDLGGFSNAIGSLTGGIGSVVQNSTATPAVLTTGFTGTSTVFSGNIINGAGGALGLTKIGVGIQTLSGVNTYTGATTMQAGGITAGSVTGLSAGSAFIVQNTATLTLGGFNNTILSLSDGGTAGGTVNNANATSAVLTFGDATNTRFNGLIQDGAGGGTLGLTKQGTGTTIFGGANTFTGPVTINAGTLQAGISSVAGVSGALGNAAPVTINGTGAIDLGGFSVIVGSLTSASGTTLVKNSTNIASTLTTGGNNSSTTFAGVIQDGTLPGGQVSLVKTGTGIFRLSGVNTYTGTTTITGGTLQTGVVNSLSTGTDVTVGAAGIFDLNNNAQSIGSLAGAAGAQVTLGSAVLTTGNDAAVNTAFSGVISGTTVNSGITKVGGGTFTLDGAVANSYAGPTRVNDGVLILNKTANINATGTGVGGLFIGDGVGGVASAIVRITTNNQIADATAVTIASDGRFDVNGLFETVGSISSASAAAQITLGVGNLITGDSTNTTYAGSITGIGGNLTKQGTGIWTVSGLNNYSGTTTVSGGSLLAGSTTAFGLNSAVSVGANSILDLGGFNNSIGSLTGGGANSFVQTSGASATLTTGGDNTSPVGYTGVLRDVGANKLSLTKIGTGTQTLGGQNTFSGPTTVSAGTLAAGVAGNTVSGAFSPNSQLIVQTAGTVDLKGFSNVIGSLSDGGTSGGNVINTGALATLSTGNDNLNATFAGAISGATTALTKIGTGTQTLSGANTFSGATTVSAGVLKAGANGGVGSGAFSPNSALIVQTNGTVDLNGFSNTVASLSDGGTLGGVVTNTNAAAGTLVMGNGGAGATFAGVIKDGAGKTNITKIGAGVEILSGVNTYTGTSSVNGGTLQAGSTTGLSSTSAFLVNTGGTLGLNGFNSTILSLSDTGAPGGTVQNGAAAGTAVLTFGDANNLTFHGTMVNGGAGTLGITKVGAGTEILTGVSTYTGATTITTGKLQVDGSLGATAVTVQSGATLSGIGSIGGTVTVNAGGILAPGDSPGTITVAGLVLNSGSLVNYELGTPGVVTPIAPFINDLTIVNGALTLDGTLTVTNAGGFGPGSYRLFNYTGALTNNTLDVNPVPGGFTSYVSTNIANQVNLIVLGPLGAGTTQYWDGPNLVANGIVDGGTGTWVNNNSSNWTDAVGAVNSNWQNGTAVFQGATGTVTLGDNINFQGLVFNTGSYTINAGAGPFRLLADGAVTITTALNAAPTTINAVIADSILAPGTPGSLTTQGGGTLILTANNTYSGSTTINDGILSIQSLANGGAASGIGQSSNAATNLVFNGGTLQYTGAGAATTDRLFSVGTNGGKLDSSGAGAVNFTNPGAMGFNGQLGARTLELTGTNAGNNTIALAIGNNGGATSLVKSGAGTWVLSGLNTYSGTTTINAGTLKAGSTTGLSATSAFLVNTGGTLDINGFASTILSLSDNNVGPVFGTVTNNGALAAVLTFGDSNNLAFHGNIVNGVSAIGITKVGTGIETLTGNNTYTGPTTVNAGTLRAGSTTAFGTNSVVAVNLNGTLDLGGFSNTIGALTSTVPGGTVQNNAAAAATLTISGVAGLPATFAGNIINVAGSGALSLTKNGAGVQTLSGVNTYNGVTTINLGTLMAGSTTAFGTNSAVNITAAGATLDLGGFSNSIGSLQGVVGSIATTTNGPATLTTGGDGIDAIFAGNLINGTPAPGIDILSLTKVGAGKQTLSGVNTYTGATNINGGTLLAGSITGLSSTSAFLVNTGGKLDLNGFNSTILSLTDTGAPGGTIQNGAAGNAVLTFGDANNLTFHGNIISGPGAGTLGITKQGTGTETLTGVNTYTGPTVINNGRLLAGSTTAFGVGSAVTVGALGTLDLGTFNNSIGNLSGSGIVKNTGVGAATLTITNPNGSNFSGKLLDDGPLGLTLNGPGTQILSGISSYSGDTNINGPGATLQAGSVTAFSPNSKFFVNTGGTLDLFGFSNTILALTDTGLPGGTVTTSVGAATLTFGDANNLTFHGNITGAGFGITKQGTGIESLTGNNTYAGATQINAGGFLAGSTTAFSANSAFTLNNGTSLDLGGFSNSVGSLAGIAGSVVRNSTATPATLTEGGLGTSTTFGGNIIDGAGAPLSLTKIGAGTLTLSGVNTYSGRTTINAGGITAGSAGALSATSAFLVNTTGTLSVNGWNSTILSLSDNGAPGGTVQNGAATNAVLAFGDANNLQFHGVIQNGGAGTLGITKNGTGAETLSGLNTYTGPTVINNGKLIGGSTSAFGVNSAVSLTAAGTTLDLGGFNNTLGSLAGVAGSVVTDSVANAVLTVGTLNQNTVFAGNMLDGLGAVLSFTKVGTGIQTLSGNNAYSGPTIITAGEILAGSTTALSANSAFNLNTAGAILDLGGFSNTIGSLAGVAGTTVQTVAGPATLTVGGNNTSTTFAGLITNSLGNHLSLVKNGNGTFTISGANTYTGPTTLNAGGLFVNNNTALGTGNLIINNAGAGSTLGSSVGAITFANKTQVNGDFSVAPTGTLTSSGAVTLNGTFMVTGTNGNRFTFSGPVGEAAPGTGITFTSAPASVFQYAGSSANTYTGLTTVKGNATLELNKSPGVNAVGAGGLTLDDSATALYLASNQVDDAATINVLTTSTLNLNGHNETVQTVNSAVGATIHLDATGPGGTLTVTSGLLDGLITDVGQAGSIVKNGGPADVLTITHANTYSGFTTLNGGVLNINNNTALGTSTFVINGGLVGNTDLTQVSHTFANAITVQGSFAVNGPQQLISTGPVSLAIQNTTITTNAGGLDFSGVISEVNPVSNLTFTGATNTTFSGGGSNTYTGLTDVQGGFLMLAKTGGALAVAGNLEIGGGGTVKFGGPAASNQQIAATSNVDIQGALDLNGHTQAINALTGNGSVRLGDTALTAGRLTVNSGNFSGNISDNGPSGQLVKTSPGVLTLTGKNTLTGQTTVQQGTLFLDGSVGGNVVVFTGALLGGNGTVGGNLTNSGNVSPGHSPGTLTVNGSYTQAATGKLTIEIAGLAANQHDLLAVHGGAALGGTVEIIPLNNFSLHLGDKVIFLTANNVSGKFSIETVGVTTDSNFLKATVLYETSDVALVAQQLAFEQVLKGLTPNQKAVARALDKVLTDPRMAKIIAYLDYDTFGNVPHDLDLIAPEEMGSLYTIGISQANVQSANIERRMDDLRAGTHGFSAAGLSVSGGMPQYSGNFGPATPNGLTGPSGKGGKEIAPPTQDLDLGVFFTGTGEFTHVGSTYNASGYDLASGGFTLGVDYLIGEHFAIGINAGYSRTSADISGNGRISVDGGKLGVYATYFDGGFHADFSAQGGYNSYDTRRTALAGTARGSTTGGEFNGLFALGYDFKAGGLTIGPIANVQYTYVGFRGFTEKGSLAPLQFQKQNGESLRTAVGMKASYDLQLGGVIVRPEVRAAWQHEFDDAQFAIYSRFANGAGNQFTVHSAETGRDSALVSAGVAVLWNERTSSYVYYDGEIGRSNFDSHNVSAGTRVEF